MRRLLAPFGPGEQLALQRSPARPVHCVTWVIVSRLSPALADAVHLGLIASEARPGGNVTGIEPYVAGLPAKQMELACEVVPGATKIGLITNLVDPKAPPQLKELEAAGRSLGVNLIAKDPNRVDELEGALQSLADEKVDVVIVLQTSMLISQTRHIADSALAKRSSAGATSCCSSARGGLISYGVDLRSCYQRAAAFVDKILRGSAPGNLPVEFPTTVMLSLNLKAAKALGLTIPQSIMLRADEVIE